MSRFFHPQNLLPLAAGFALALAPACGSDDDGVGPDADTDVDAAEDEPDADDAPDADVDEDEVGGTISVTDVIALADDDGAITETPLGGSVNVEFFEPGTGDGDVVHDGVGDGDVGCIVTVFGEDDDLVAPGFSEGRVDISGTEVGEVGDDDDAGFTCEFDDELEQYVCTVTAGEADLELVEECDGLDLPPVNNCPLSDEDSVLVIKDTNLTEQYDLAGSYVTVAGFGEDIDGQPVPVLDATFEEEGDDSATFIALPQDTVGDDHTADEGSYAFTIGAPDEAFAEIQDFAFLDAEGDNVVSILAEDTSDAVGDIDVELFPLGQGMELAEGVGEGENEDELYIQPFQFLEDEAHADGVFFSCDEDLVLVEDGDEQEGNCGVESSEGDGIAAMVVTGGTIPADEGDDVAAFQCNGIGDTVEVSADAIAAILELAPAGVVTSVTHGQASTGDVNVLVGHTLQSSSAVDEDLIDGDDNNDND